MRGPTTWLTVVVHGGLYFGNTTNNPKAIRYVYCPPISFTRTGSTENFDSSICRFGFQLLPTLQGRLPIGRLLQHKISKRIIQMPPFLQAAMLRPWAEPDFDVTELNGPNCLNSDFGSIGDVGRSHARDSE
jgi:hypothetical protein